MSVLFVVATPIGNLEDITLRALRILKEADLILCEDTRVTKKLLEHYQIKTPTAAYHQHSDLAATRKFIDLLKEGRNLALVTDAGTPGLCDPGGFLVEQVIKEAKSFDLKVEAVPGASALTAAISVAGLPMDKFLFLGFLPHKKGRQTMLKQIEASRYPVILYESVHRITKLLDELSGLVLAEVSTGKRDYYLVVARELTKKFETVYRGTVEEVKKQLKQEEIKGEFVVIIDKQK